MSNKSISLAEIPIGGTSPTGNVRVAKDMFIANWVIEGAPFHCRESRKYPPDGTWIVENKDNYLYNYGLTREKAEEKAEELNAHAALAILVRID
jgi:hypothetical protein